MDQIALRKILKYNPDTGVFTWIVDIGNLKLKGKRAGCKNNGKYLQIGINGKTYMAHRLAWLYMTGMYPKLHIDHINGVKDDNRWCNLRICNRSQNQCNRKVGKSNRLGIKGVDLHNGRFRAVTQYLGIRYELGGYGTAETASMVYEWFANKLHGKFYRGRNKNA